MKASNIGQPSVKRDMPVSRVNHYSTDWQNLYNNAMFLHLQNPICIKISVSYIYYLLKNFSKQKFMLHYSAYLAEQFCP
jgi:hypothetical protein